jgi:hypothetical protein
MLVSVDIVARLLVGTSWYDGLASEALLESEYEILILQSGADIYPGWHFVPFKIEVHSEFGCKRADFALVDHEYRTWFVVEVEMAHHPLEGHVLPQVEVLASGKYGLEHAEYLLAKAPHLDRQSVIDMVRGAPPKVLVIVNLPMPTWIVPLRQRGVALSIVEIFRSDRAEHALRLNGDQPRVPVDMVSRCHRVEMLPRLFQMDTPVTLGGGHGDLFDIDFDGLESSWARVDLADRVCLSPTGGNPISSARSIDLIRLPDGRLSFVNPRST